MPLRPLQQLTIDADVVHFGVRFGPQFGDDGAVDLHASGSDEFFSFAAGSDSGSGDYLLETLWGHVGRVSERGIEA